MGWSNVEQGLREVENSVHDIQSWDDFPDFVPYGPSEFYDLFKRVNLPQGASLMEWGAGAGHNILVGVNALGLEMYGIERDKLLVKKGIELLTGSALAECKPLGLVAASYFSQTYINYRNKGETLAMTTEKFHYLCQMEGNRLHLEASPVDPYESLGMPLESVDAVWGYFWESMIPSALEMYKNFTKPDCTFIGASPFGYLYMPALCREFGLNWKQIDPACAPNAWVVTKS